MQVKYFHQYTVYIYIYIYCIYILFYSDFVVNFGNEYNIINNNHFTFYNKHVISRYSGNDKMCYIECFSPS